jgi:hypothetical protein
MAVDFMSRLVYYEPSDRDESRSRQKVSDGARFVTEGRWVGP